MLLIQVSLYTFQIHFHIETVTINYIFQFHFKYTFIFEIWLLVSTDPMGKYSRHVQNVTSRNEVWTAHMPKNENLSLPQTETFPIYNSLSINSANKVEGIIPLCTSSTF